MKYVPKCKECKTLYQYKIGKKTYYECDNEETIGWRGESRRIYSVWIGTSPMWCPLRNKTE
jgi:hypothetical protein